MAGNVLKNELVSTYVYTEKRFSMQSINLSNPNLIMAIALALLVLSVFYFLLAFRKQREAISKVKDSLRLQGQANRHLENVVKELRRSNRFLGQLVDMEFLEDPADAQGEAVEEEETLRESHKLYVGNIDYGVTEEELESYFSGYGDIDGVNIPVNRYTGKARGFGFVTFSSKEDAQKAMVLNGTEFKGREIQVNFAKEREANS